MYFAVVNKSGEFLEGESQGSLIFGAVTTAAVLNQETRHLWNKFYPGLNMLLETKDAALVSHPDRRFVGISPEGFGIYEVDGDPNYRIYGDRLFEIDMPYVEIEEEEAFDVV